MRKALVAPSVGMATAPSVPASGRSILDDDGGGGGGDGDGGGGGSSGGGGGSDDGDGDDDDAQIRKDECAMGVRRGVEIGHRILFQIAIRTRSSPLTNLPTLPRGPASGRSTCVGAAESRNDGNDTLQNNCCAKMTVCKPECRFLTLVLRRAASKLIST